MAPRKTRAAKQAQQEAEKAEAEISAQNGEAEETVEMSQEEAGKDASVTAVNSAPEVDDKEAASNTSTMEERLAKMKDLRKKMADSTMANRKAVATELNRHKQNAREQSSLAKKLQKAEKTLDKRDAEERGDDWERSKAWGYSIEDNERWEEKLEKKEEGKDRGVVDPNTAAERSYRRQIKQIKPDLKAYQSIAPATSSSSTALMSTPASNGSSQIIKRDALQISDPALIYGEHRPDDAALDRVAGHLNSEAVLRNKHSRKRTDDPDAEVNYINDKNKHYNKKIARFYDKYTKEIRDNFERGTAL